MTFLHQKRVLLHIAVIALAAAVVSAQAPVEPELTIVNALEPEGASDAANAAVAPDLTLKITPQQAASRSRQCSSCTGSPVAPVCAEVGGISVTVASRCIAECQELSNIRPGTCEDLAADSPGEINTQSAALVQPDGASRAVAPGFRSTCRPSSALMQQMLLEGKTFVGCVQAASKAAAAQAATKPANATSAVDLLASLKPSDTVVLTERVVASRGGALFLKPVTVTVAALTLAKTPSSASLPGRRAPTSEAFSQALSQAAAAATFSVDTAGNDTSVLAAMAQATAARLEAASAASAAFEPMADLPEGAAVGGNRRLAQVVDNRQMIRDTTAWPWPAVTKITAIGCSGTLISPDDVVTAAHCVVDSVTGRSFQPFTITPGKNGALEPYGRQTSSVATWWNIWVGGQYNGENRPIGGSAYIDVAVIRLDRGPGWWSGMSFQLCGRRAMSVRSCGYPGGPWAQTPPGATAGNWLYCSDGTTSPIDYCDFTTDYIRSRNSVASRGQSGGPLFDRSTNAVTGVVTGGPQDMSDNWYTPFDNFNWPLLHGTANTATIWSRTFLFRSTRGPIRSALHNKCLDAPNWTAGQRVHMWDCHGGENQLWAHPGAPTRATEMRLTVGNNRNLCLDANSQSTANGTPIITWFCNNGDNQKWFFDHNGRLRSVMNSNKCLDIISSNRNNGAQLVLWDCNGGANQRWIEG